MKIRSNYVSNSSSSSFLIVYENENFFNKFKEFNGYTQFINDIKKENKEEAIGFIQNFLCKYWSFTHRQYLKKDISMIGNLETNMYINFLFEESKVDDKEFWEIIQETNKIGFEFWDKNKDNLNWKNPEYKAYEESYYKNKNVEYKIDDIGKQIYDGLIKNNNFIKFVRYKDDTDEGAYMEQRFMPFLSNNPDGGLVILTQNEH